MFFFLKAMFISHLSHKMAPMRQESIRSESHRGYWYVAVHNDQIYSSLKRILIVELSIWPLNITIRIRFREPRNKYTYNLGL